MKTFFKKHALNILLALALVGLYIACLFLPIFSVYALLLIVPISAYLMHRYISVLPPLATLGFAALCYFASPSAVYLFFVPICLAGQIGLYVARQSSFFKAAAICIACVACGSVVSVGVCIAAAGNNDMPALIANEVLKGKTEFVKANARAYFNQVYPTDEDKAGFRMPSDVQIPDDVDEEEYSILYVYSVYVESTLREQLLSYIFKYAVILGAGGYIIAGLLIRFFAQELIGVAEKPLIVGDITLPKGYLLYVLPLVLLVYLLSLGIQQLQPISLAVYHSMLLAPSALAGITFLAYITRLFKNLALQIVVIGVIIILIVLCAFFSAMLIILAVVGLIEYLLRLRKLIQRLQEPIG